MLDPTGAVSVIGLGKLGACIAAALAKRGRTVIGVDVRVEAVDALNAGKAPVEEPGLAEIVASARPRLSATRDAETAVRRSSVTFVVVPTPSEPSGAFSLDLARDAFCAVGRGIREKKDWHLIVLTSTVLPGATRHALVPALEEASGKRCGKDFGVCYSPAFIALGTVIRDFLNPDLVIVGESDERSGAALEALYGEILENEAPVRRMSMENAELAKLGVNTFVTTKIAFANMLADLCERIPGGDVDVVTGALGLDRRIGRPYLTGGLGYGGPCFPRDNQALSFLARSLGTTALLAETTDRMNREIPARLMARIDGEAGPGKTVAVLGLAYKPGTSVIEESQAVLLARALAAGGATVRAYDPLAGEPVRAELEPEVCVTASLEEAVHDADLILVCTPDERFRELPQSNGRSRQVTIVDCWRLLAGQIPAVSATVRYLPVGRSPEDLTRSERLASLWEGATAVPASSNGSPAVANTPSESALQNGRGQ